jgi:hypothetical protein
MANNAGSDVNRPDSAQLRSNIGLPGVLKDPGRKLPPPRDPNDIPHILPHEKVFPIQIGSELFRLSGASISSDGQYNSFESFAAPRPSISLSSLQPDSSLEFQTGPLKP